MSLFVQIEDTLDEIDYLPYMETVKFHWSIMDDDTVYYISQKEVYSGEIKEGIHEQDDCFFINTDNGCGETVTLVCKSDSRLSYEDFWDKYGEDM